MLQTVIAAEAPLLFTAFLLLAQTATDRGLDSVSFICCHNEVVGVAVGALYERPRYISCAKPPIALSSGGQLPICNPEAKTFEVGFELCALGVFPDNNR